jgi:hypothetical protein
VKTSAFVLLLNFCILAELKYFDCPTIAKPLPVNNQVFVGLLKPTMKTLLNGSFSSFMDLSQKDFKEIGDIILRRVSFLMGYLGIFLVFIKV